MFKLLNCIVIMFVDMSCPFTDIQLTCLSATREYVFQLMLELLLVLLAYTS